MSFVTIEPATGRQVRSYEPTDPAALDDAVQATVAAQAAWARRSFADRAKVLDEVAARLEERAEPLGRLMALEMGKPVGQGEGEAKKCAWVCRYFAEKAEAFLATESSEADGGHVAYRPLGAVLAVMPWNFPLWQVYRFAAPALMAGNAGFLKHAPNVQGCAEAIVELFAEAGLPEGLFTNLRLEPPAIAELIRRQEVAAVTLTGSTRAGRAVAEAAGSALKKSVLELGGSDAYVVLEDADVEATVAICVQSRLLNSGQSCIAAKRFIVVPEIHDAFTEAFVEAMRAKTWGNPLEDADVDLGPMAREDLRDDLHDQVVRSRDAGVPVLLGGEKPDRPGWFYPPTVLGDVVPGTPAFDEETFGPVAAIVRAKDEADAIALANRSRYGLGAAVFTQDLERGRRIAEERLEAGSVAVNDFVKSDPRLPFGGIKESGYGRELAAFGIREFVNIKTVSVPA